jgi:hypothetical protein
LTSQVGDVEAQSASARQLVLQAAWAQANGAHDTGLGDGQAPAAQASADMSV